MQHGCNKNEVDAYKIERDIRVNEERLLGKFLLGSGCCVICFESNPLVLEEHHVAGRRNSDITFTVCANHHAILSRMQRSWLRAGKSVEEREAFLFRGFADLLKVKSDHLLGVG